MAEVRLERTEPPASATGWRLSWGAIFAGLVVALVVQVILTLFGIAFGVGVIGTETDPQMVGYGAIVWMILTVLLALFAGGVTTGRMAGILRTKDATAHGVVLGGLSTLLALWLVVGGLGMVVGGAFGVLERSVAQAAQPQQGQGMIDAVEQQVRAMEQRMADPDTIVERAGAIVQDAAPHVATGALIAALAIIISIGAAVGGVNYSARD
jgi:hypothetical protein